MLSIARLIALLTSLAACLAASGCINSRHDISPGLKAEFPLKDGFYKNVASGDEVFQISRVSDNQDWYEVRGKSERVAKSEYFRLFRIPEFDGFVVQGIDNPINPYGYFFIEIKDGAVQEQLFADHKNLPSHIQGLIRVGSHNVMGLVNDQRDTLFVIREAARHRAFKPNRRFQLEP